MTAIGSAKVWQWMIGGTPPPGYFLVQSLQKIGLGFGLVDVKERGCGLNAKARRVCRAGAFAELII